MNLIKTGQNCFRTTVHGEGGPRLFPSCHIPDAPISESLKKPNPAIRTTHSGLYCKSLSQKSNLWARTLMDSMRYRLGWICFPWLKLFLKSSGRHSNKLCHFHELTVLSWYLLMFALSRSWLKLPKLTDKLFPNVRRANMAANNGLLRTKKVRMSSVYRALIP